MQMIIFCNSIIIALPPSALSLGERLYYGLEKDVKENKQQNNQQKFLHSEIQNMWSCYHNGSFRSQNWRGNRRKSLLYFSFASLVWISMFSLFIWGFLGKTQHDTKQNTLSPLDLHRKQEKNFGVE